RYLVASTVDVTDTATLKTEAVLGAGDNVYCTTETLYATTDAETDDTYSMVYDGRSVGTQIFKFDIRGGDIRFLKNVTVRGWSLDQFSMDEYKGNLRIATTTGYWGENTESQIYVLDANLNTLGILPHVGKGETIRAVRFMGDTAYVVTFEQTDPLFVIDLSNPSNPTLKGEVKLPGFSSYLHPVGDGLLLGIGYGGDEEGTDGTLKVSLFDVSDPTAPREAANYIVGGDYDWVSSSALDDHKAVCWDEKTLTLYLPVTAESYAWAENDDSYYGADAMIFALRVDPQAKTLTETASYVTPRVVDTWKYLDRCTWFGGYVYGVTFNGSSIFAFDRATGAYIGEYAF
ncbi:MAG: beta-propeller domain-containing protein, partial [Clostridia bacterium]|nr:beta-propeller domain-containing protein [Clostridia bacterium]